LLNLYIPSFTYDELKKFSLVDRKTSNLDSNLFIPKLSDFLAICKAYRKTAFLTIAYSMKNDNLDRIIEEVEDNYSIKNTKFISKNKKQLLHLSKKVDNHSIFLDVDHPSAEAFDFCKNHGFNMNISYHNISDELVKDMHLIGLKVSAGVVNDKEVAERLIRHDVDYVFTDILE
jgi:glycerophosphoryl diester phosphodiesterase